ncbi:MAG: ABC-ATPase domain-containing protein, partial [Lachnospiraceae bacterium]|nr:ABC-ATPase domain-containing protein [Lachnospiraceae bacterium]
IALQDFLLRAMAEQFAKESGQAKGSGKSGLLFISRCGQKVLERSACVIEHDRIVVRFQIGFPAFGRTINAGELEKILFGTLPECVENSLFFAKLDQRAVKAAVELSEDQEALRAQMREHGVVSFVADGAILPRQSGVSELPMKGAIAFISPERMRKTFILPHRGKITGMAIPRGITLIAGGGYHGKSTLLEAIQNGVYNHIAGDGREFVLTDRTAVKQRAEDGRSIRKVNIDLFIHNLPNRKDTTEFSTEDASGSTSQAAGLIESIEAGSGLLLLDEDTSATNFMVRDRLMQEVISRDKEPITPFIERARDLYDEAGISTIMVAGSSGAFFYLADHILLLDNYRVREITEEVKAVCAHHPAPSIHAPGFQLPEFHRVLPAFRRIQSRDSRHDQMKVKTFGVDSLSLDRETVDVRYLEQIIDSEQTMALAYLMRYCLENLLDGKRTVRQVVSQTMELLEKKGWEAFCRGYVPGGLAKTREQELYACLNRFRG